MNDMDPVHVAGNAVQTTLTYFDGQQRSVLASTTEVPYPEGKLIVSRTDTRGIITHCNQAFIDMSGYQESELIGQPMESCVYTWMACAGISALMRTPLRA